MLTNTVDLTLRVPDLPEFNFTVHGPEADRAVSAYIYHCGCWEPFETTVFQRLISRFAMFLDLGATIGWYTVVAQLLMTASSEIHAFEPDPDNFALLSRNANRVSAVRAHLNERAVSDQAGDTNLFRSLLNYGDHQLYATSELRYAVPVPMTTLDIYFAERTLPPLLVKMDTQGSELRILQGGRSIFSAANDQNAYMVEFWPFGIENAGGHIEDYIAILEELPQLPYVIVQGAQTLKPITWHELRQQCAPGGPLAPATQLFIDLAMLTPGTSGHRAVADLIVAD